MPERRLSVREIFDEASELPPGDRQAYLNRACGSDAALRAKIEELLRSDAAAGDFLADPTRSATIAVAPVTEMEGDRIGRYKILERVGEGGCGVVYVAEQTEPVRRRVALKVIKLGMDTKQVVARFEAERQALAMMDHPNIAKVLDGGSTEAGRPYFVMELVRGIKITDYCDQANLPTKDRLGLFIQVCQAIQHAHQKGIIHRDIKPSNILVTLNDGAPVPKVIDFGIAKATEGRLTDATVYTQLHQFIGTPAYMSPEQAEMSSLDIDTRSDIYSLGVLLYELLAGATPFDGQELMSLGIDGMRKTIREMDPVRPSTRLATLKGDDLTTAARRRSVEAPRLIHLVQGDLDWIVMKCLEKDRTRRYDTANGLVMDINRHLNNETVVARPPTNLYRFQKLVRRNKLAFVAVGAVALALVLGVVASAVEAIRARVAEQQQIQLRQKAEADEKRARIEAAKATAISDFLQQALRSANPDKLKGADYTVRQMLDDFSAGLKNQFTNQPEVEAAVRDTLGQTYYRLGLADKSQAQLEQALRLRREIFGSNEIVAATLVDYAWTSFDQERFAKGESQAREALEIYRKLGTEGQPIIAALWALQENLISQNRYADVESVTQEAMNIAAKTPKVEYPEMASIIHGLAQVEDAQSKFAEAEVHARQAVEMHRRMHGAQHPETGWALLGLGRALRGQQKLDEAERAIREALAIFRRQYSFGHKSVDMSVRDLEGVLEAKGNTAELAAFYQETLAGQRESLGNHNPAVAATLMKLAAALQAQGRSEEAATASKEALEIILNFNGQDPARLPSLVQSQAEEFLSKGKGEQAEKLFEAAINNVGQKLGATNIVLGELLHDYAEFLAHENKFQAAAEYHLKSLPIRRPQHDDNLAWTLRDLGSELILTGKAQEAEPYLREALAVYRALHQQKNIYGTAWPSERLAYALNLQHKWPEAEQQCLDALADCEACQAVPGGVQADVVYGLEVRADIVMGRLQVLNAENKLSEGDTLCRETLAQQRDAFTNTDPYLVGMVSALLQNLNEHGEQADAERAVREATDDLLKLPGQEFLKLPYSTVYLMIHQGPPSRASNICDKVLAATSADADWLNSVSRKLATTVFQSLVITYKPAPWDSVLAVELAQKAAAATGRKNAGILDTLAAACAANGQFTNAVSIQREAIALLHDDGPTNDFSPRLRLYESNLSLSDVHPVLAARAYAFLTNGQFAEAELPARKCLALRAIEMPDEWLTFNAQSMLGGALLGQKKYAEAEPLLLSGYEGMMQRQEKIPADFRDLRLGEAIQRLVQLFQETSRPEKAAEWRSKLAAFNQTVK